MCKGPKILGIDTDDKDNPIMLNQSHHINHLLQRHHIDKKKHFKTTFAN
jgi:hypothetical protein